jgi:hypothetical protein
MWSLEKYIKEWYDVRVHNQIFLSSHESLVLDHEKDKGDEAIEDYIPASRQEEEKVDEGRQGFGKPCSFSNFCF